MKNKKAIEKKLVSIALMTIAVLVVLFIFYGPEQAFSKVKGISSSISSGISKLVRVGQPEVRPIDVTAPHELEVAFDELDRVFKKWAAEPALGCLINYSELPDFEKECIIIIIREYGYNQMVMELQCPDEFGAYRTVKRTSNGTKLDLFPCIIGGKDIAKNSEYIAADNFWNNWIDKKFDQYPEFTEPEEIWITGKYTLEAGDKSYDLEDEGLRDSSGEEISYLYKSTSFNICFFVTNDVYNHDENGIEDGYVYKMADYVPCCEES